MQISWKWLKEYLHRKKNEILNPPIEMYLTKEKEVKAILPDSTE